MNIAKALKVKNRLAGEVSKLQDIVRRENSRRNDNPSKVNVEESYSSLFNTINSLIALKASISRASAAIADKLSRLTELKAHINWINSLPTREGIEKISYGHSKDVHDYEWTAFFNRERLDAEIEVLQDEINKLQDEVDDYNAKTSVDYNN
jgi:uncharacterized protein Veg